MRLSPPKRKQVNQQHGNADPDEQQAQGPGVGYEAKERGHHDHQHRTQLAFNGQHRHPLLLAHMVADDIQKHRPPCIQCKIQQEVNGDRRYEPGPADENGQQDEQKPHQVVHVVEDIDGLEPVHGPEDVFCNDRTHDVKQTVDDAQIDLKALLAVEAGKAAEAGADDQQAENRLDVVFYGLENAGIRCLAEHDFDEAYVFRNALQLVHAEGPQVFKARPQTA